MKTLFNFSVSILLVFLCLLSLTTQAAPTDTNLPHLTLSDFLGEMELTFDEYISIVGAFEADGIYTHKVEKFTTRYDNYRTNNPDLSDSTIYAHVNVNIDYGHYKNIKGVPEQELSGVTMLVNKNFGLAETWQADDMVDIGAGFMVRQEASEHLVNMIDAIQADGLRVYLRSTYRSGSTSARLYRDAVAQHGTTVADLNWARGGHSEHQTALAADILQRTDTDTLTEARFENSDEYRWMLENAHQFGFILRYPAEYEDIHGYKFEPWHWRYVGIEIATAMKNEGIIVYEEFYGKYLASEVLHSAKGLILSKRAFEEEEEKKRLEQEELDRQAAEEAALAAEEAAREAELAALEEAEQTRLEAERIAELARLEAERLAEEMAVQAQREKTIMIFVTCGLILLLCCTAVFMYVKMKQKVSNKHGSHN